MVEIEIISQDISNFLVTLDNASIKMYFTAEGWVVKLTEYAKLKMKQYANFKSIRTTGSLQGSISADYKISSSYIMGKAYVPDYIKYALIQETGTRGGKMIWGKPKMKFPVGNWKKGMNPALMKLSYNGYFVFSYVRRGKFEGKHYTEKAYANLLNYFNKIKNKIPDELVNDITLRM
jgi:hypothetical protein